jgi:hypothetical protein
MKEEYIPKTVFKTMIGHYEFIMTLGMTNTPTTLGMTNTPNNNI